MATRGALAAKADLAVYNILAHAESLARDNEEVKDKIEAVRNVGGRDYQHRHTYLLEAIADLLRAVDESTLFGGSAEDELDGMTKQELLDHAKLVEVEVSPVWRKEQIRQTIREARGG